MSCKSQRTAYKLIAGLLAIVTLALLLCSCGKKEDSIVGEWKFDIANSELSSEDLMTLFSQSGGGDSMKLIAETIGPDGMKEVLSTLFSAVSYVFNEDGTYFGRVDPQHFREGLIVMSDKLFDAQAKMDLETAAKVNGVTVAELQAQLNSSGKTWAEYCELMKVSTRQTLNTTFNDAALAQTFGNNATYKNGVYESESKEYILEGSQLSFIDSDKQKKGSWTVSVKGDTITIVKAIIKAEDATMLGAFFEGMKLAKVS